MEGNFRADVTTKSGKFLTGMLAGESRTAIELFDAEGKKQSILRDEVEELVATPKSLMPEGFEKQVSRKDLTDLLEFLTQRGKYLPLPLNNAATVVTTRGMFNDESAQAERLVFADWSPKTFSGAVSSSSTGRRSAAQRHRAHGPQGKFRPRCPDHLSK